MIHRTALVVGASGLIGNTLWRKLPSTVRIGTCFRQVVPDMLQLDIRDQDATRLLVKSIMPEVIYHSAALPNVDWCEDHRDECWGTNVYGTGSLAHVAHAIGAKLVFFSSDYVFDGKSGSCTEDAPPCPLNVYGEAKLAAERLIHAQVDNYLIVRTTGVYGWERQGKNFVSSLINRLSKGETVKVPNDQFGSPTYVDNLADVVLELVRKDYGGIFHIVGNEVMDRFSFARNVAQVFDLDENLIQPASAAELGQRAVRPLRVVLINDKVKSCVTTPLIGPHEGLRQMKAVLSEK